MQMRQGLCRVSAPLSTRPPFRRLFLAKQSARAGVGASTPAQQQTQDNPIREAEPLQGFNDKPGSQAV
jgi:hypothetical protein